MVRSQLSELAARMDAVETLVGAGTPIALTKDDKAVIIAALGQLIELSRDELAGRGLYQQHKAEGDRIYQLQQQIEAWEALLEKLVGNE
ncbi:hypothetical protein [Coleofasciculus sp. FACHB-542]|uniref:hypothetical protein n=1 Tax=Coleofasciculus sp. FACHB-542 TaxID=2692787 RepID=UPI0016865AA5|nr:hypothetical protein [Coleofasciculus sp. FACHB-542]MBD2087892.1 hypothetical protein [Coleofasciculus sp. FACHB-542]